MSKKTQSKNAMTLIVIAGIMIVCVIIGIAVTNRIGKTNSQLTRESALAQLDKKLKRIEVTESSPRKATVEISNSNLADELPDITKYPLSVEGKGQLNLEIFSSTEKSSSGTDGWLNEIAEDFNAAHYEIDGKWATISVRPIASGAAIDYIVSGKYVPELYSPSNELWGEMLAAENVNIKLLESRLAGNTTGILLTKDTYSEIENAYGKVDISSVIEATIKSEIAMGYTNPYASSTGLNFLISALQEFDAADILSSTSVSKFQQFQQNVPFVAYTTLQMREAAANGVLDAFILEYQCYSNVSELRNYKFVPFGVRHDSPMYSLVNLTEDESSLARLFIDYCLTEDSQKLATKYGFNALEDYSGSLSDSINGAAMLSAQKLWKTEKDAGSPVMAVFVADVSGSMNGARLQNLQASLINASQYINTTNYVGLISYSDDVTINLPIDEFTLNQRSYFTGAVEDLSALGNTATYDAVLVGLDMLMDKQAEIEAATGQTVKPMLFVLSDGETNMGNSLREISGIIEGLGVPCYTIGYNANLDALAELSSINEAASINADNDDVIYTLKSLFNAQM